MWDLTVPDDHDFYVLSASALGYDAGAKAPAVLVHNECSPELKAYANSLDQKSEDIGAVSRLTTRQNPNGYFGHNMDRSGIGDVDWEARQAIDAAGGHHMGCAEIGCISDAFEAEDPMEGAMMETVHFCPWHSLSPHSFRSLRGGVRAADAEYEDPGY